jgi:4-hydroxybenzoate polyprenyltransferase
MRLKTIQIRNQGFGRRMAGYLAEMYPIPSRLTISVLLYLSFVTLLGRVNGRQPDIFSTVTLTGIFDVFAISLILRLMDELKDRELDGRLFADRPLPSGRVRETDIKLSLLLACLTYVIVNIPFGLAFSSALGLLGYTFLMFRYFFMPPSWHKHLLVNLATHNPVVPLMLLHLTVLFAVQSGLRLDDIARTPTLLLIGMFWTLFLSWEIARKIRYRHEETEYITYSKILGRIGAALTSFTVQAAGYAIGFYFFLALKLTPVFPVLLTIGFAYLIAQYARFLRGTLPAGIELRRAAEIYAANFMAATVTETLIIPVVRHVS